MFAVRTTAPLRDNPYYKWGVESEGQCTWGVFYRCAECSFSPPCYWDRATKTGSYTNAKLWLENWREPWEVKGSDYKPVAGDIAVFDGNYGHVCFIERVDGKNCLISDWNRIAPLTYASDTWEYGTRLKGCGELLGYLHFPYDTVETVDRNPNVNQIETTDDSLRIRNNPRLSGSIVGHVQLGYYNVLSIVDATEEDKRIEPKLKYWYEIAKDRWCANITVNYLPIVDGDIVKELERYFNGMKQQITALKDENTDLKKSFKEVYTISKKWAE